MDNIKRKISVGREDLQFLYSLIASIFVLLGRAKPEDWKLLLPMLLVIQY
jgi:hypothetical protein